ncbi:MAG: dephospho-CoA kinase [Phycisphaerales bacterium]
MSRPVVIGMAGGIASGKSRVASEFEALGCVVVDSDKEARAALERPEVVRTLVSWWGGGILDDKGEVDRSEVASIVFNDASQRERLEGLIHPMVKHTRAEVVARAREAGAPGVIIDAPLLFEAGLDKECDATVFVEAERAVRLRRVITKRGWDEAELDRREAAQLPLDEKRRRADYVVDNQGDDEALREAVRRVFDAVRASVRA